MTAATTLYPLLDTRILINCLHFELVVEGRLTATVISEQRLGMNRGPTPPAQHYGHSMNTLSMNSHVTRSQAS